MGLRMLNGVCQNDSFMMKHSRRLPEFSVVKIYSLVLVISTSTDIVIFSILELQARIHLTNDQNP